MNQESKIVESKPLAESQIKPDTNEKEFLLRTGGDTALGNGSVDMHSTDPAGQQAAVIARIQPTDHANSEELPGDGKDLKVSTAYGLQAQPDESQSGLDSYLFSQTAEEDTSENPAPIQEKVQENIQPGQGHQRPKDKIEGTSGGQVSHPPASFQMVDNKNREDLPRANIQLEAMPSPGRLVPNLRRVMFRRAIRGRRNKAFKYLRFGLIERFKRGHKTTEEPTIEVLRNKFNLTSEVVEAGYRELSKHQIAERIFGDDWRLPLHSDVVRELLTNQTLCGRLSNYIVWCTAWEEMNSRSKTLLETNIARQFKDDPLDQKAFDSILAWRKDRNAKTISTFIRRSGNRAARLGLNEKAVDFEELANKF